MNHADRNFRYGCQSALRLGRSQHRNNDPCTSIWEKANPKFLLLCQTNVSLRASPWYWSSEEAGPLKFNSGCRPFKRNSCVSSSLWVPQVQSALVFTALGTYAGGLCIYGRPLQRWSPSWFRSFAHFKNFIVYIFDIEFYNFLNYYYSSPETIFLLILEKKLIGCFPYAFQLGDEPAT